MILSDGNVAHRGLAWRLLQWSVNAEVAISIPIEVVERVAQKLIRNGCMSSIPTDADY